MLAYGHGTGSLPQRSIIQFLFELLVAKLRETLFPKRFQTCDVNPVYTCTIGSAFKVSADKVNAVIAEAMTLDRKSVV